jgi:hypothetical protein
MGIAQIFIDRLPNSGEFPLMTDMSSATKSEKCGSCHCSNLNGSQLCLCPDDRVIIEFVAVYLDASRNVGVPQRAENHQEQIVGGVKNAACTLTHLRGTPVFRSSDL